MNGELWAPGDPSFTKPYCGKWGSAAMDPTIPRGTAMKKQNIQQKTQKNSSYS